MMSDKQEQLIDHLDESLRGKGSAEMEHQIHTDPETAREWYYLHQAVDAVQNAGLQEQVAAVKSSWLAQQSVPVKSVPAKSSGATVRSIYRNVLRVAACIFILSGGAALYKYTSTTSAGVYGKYFSVYTLGATRGAGTKDAVEQAYAGKDWTSVISVFGTLKEKDNKSYFLTGMADLELKRYDDAIDKFQHVIATNVKTGSDYFQDEAEFYLAMSWIARNDVNEAMPLLEKIKANKSHLYYETVSKMSFRDLRIIQYKNLK
jgi:tetratricopeptide (TPR) repeat protein